MLNNVLTSLIERLQQHHGIQGLRLQITFKDTDIGKKLRHLHPPSPSE
jgi:hypothetical protein